MNIEYIIIVAIVIHLLVYFYRLQNKEKIYVDLWLYSTIMLVFPYFILYPWAGDIENESSVGTYIYKLRPYLHDAFLCNTIGYISIWIGKYFYDDKYGNKVRLCNLDKMSNVVLSNDKYFNYFVLIYIPFMLVPVFLFVNYGIAGGMYIEMRKGLVQTAVNIANCGYPIILSSLLLKFYERKEKKYLIYLIPFLFIAIVLGRRGLILGPFVTLLLMIFISKKKKLNLLFVGIVAIMFIILVFAIASMRTGNDFNINDIQEKILYGNSFCDVRDFAWILSGFDNDYFYGKTYLAGLMSFIPSSFSDFRFEWSWGHVSLKLGGIYDGGFTEHGGLRGGIFTESYLNFGYIGVVLVGLIYGYISEWVNVQHKTYCKQKKFSAAYSCTIKSKILSFITISSGAFQVYASVMVIYIVYKIVSFRKQTVNNYNMPLC